MVHGFDVKIEREDDFRELINRTRPLVDDLGATLHVVRTNIKDVSLQNWEDSHMAQLACCLHQFSHQVDYGIVASSYAYSRLRPGWGSNPAMDYLLSSLDFEIVHDGAGFSRFEKIEMVAKNSLALKALKVCWQGDKQGRNCGKCRKCVQTRLNLFLANVNLAECFDSPFEMSDISAIDKDDIFCQELLGVADRQGATVDWISALRVYMSMKLPKDSEKMATQEEKNTVKSFTMPELSASAGFAARLSEQQGVVTEFVRRVGPVWLLNQMPGNMGDHLIWAGTERLMTSGGVDYVCISIGELRLSAGRALPGTLVIPGSGALVSRFHEWLPELVILASGIFDRVVILPSEYEPQVSVVSRALAQPNVYAFAREVESFARIKTFGRAALAPDPALWAREFKQTTLNGQDDKSLGKILLALRTDIGSLLSSQKLRPAALNNDISLTTTDLADFLDRIGTVDTVVSDRLHVVVGAVMLGKNVRFVDPYSNKISRYIRYNFQDEFAGRVQQRNEQWLVNQSFAESFKEWP
jgi:hypothetical protein